MKVLLLNNFHYRKGGSETVYFQTGRLLAAHGHEVLWFSFADERNVPCPQSEFFPERPSSAIGTSVSYCYNRSAAKALERLLEKEKPDIAHVHLIWGGLSPSVLKVLRRHHIPVVHTVHDYRLVCPGYLFMDGGGAVCERCSRGYFLPCLSHRCAKGSLPQSLLMTFEMYLRRWFFNPLRLIGGFHFVSKFAYERHLAHEPGYAKAKHSVIYNCLPDSPAPEVKRGDYFLYCGRLSREKGVHTLIEAFSRDSNLHLKVTGTGPLENELRAKAASAANIEFCGYRTGEDLSSLLRNCCCVIVPSEWYENNPLSIIEAYSAGKPVIGAAIGGIPEIVREGETGYLFLPSDAEGLLAAAQRLAALSDEDYASLSAGSRRFFEDHFTEEAAYGRLMEFYEELIG